MNSVQRGWKGQPRRPVVGMGHGAGDRQQPLARTRADAGDRAQQCARVRVPRRVEDRIHRPLLDHAAQVHHHHVGGHLGDHAQVVGDQHDRHAVFLLQLAHQLEDLGLRGDVQRGGGLVGDQQRRLAGQRHRDHGALPQSATELIGAADPPAAPAWRHADASQDLDRLLPRLAPPHRLVQPNRLDDLIADTVHRTERRHRLLKDQRNLRPPDRPHLETVRLELRQIHHLRRAAVGSRPPKVDLPTHDPPRPIHDPQDRPRRNALPAPALAHNPERRPGIQIEADPIDRPHGPLVLSEVRLQIPHRQQRHRFTHRAHRRTLA